MENKEKMKNVEIVNAVVGDAQGIQDVIKEASGAMYKLCGWSEKEIIDHYDPKKTKGGTDKLIESIKSFTDADILLVAKDDRNKIIGVCFAKKLENTNMIEALYVSPEFQGIGLAKKLYNQVYKLLDQNNDTFLNVFSLNSKAVGFYKKMGFNDTCKILFDDRFVGSTGEKLQITEMMLAAKK